MLAKTNYVSDIRTILPEAYFVILGSDFSFYDGIISSANHQNVMHEAEKQCLKQYFHPSLSPHMGIVLFS